MTKTLIQAMADGDDLSGFLPGVSSEDVNVAPPASVAAVAEPDKPSVSEPVPIPAGTFSKEEMDILKPKPKGPGTPGKGGPQPIAGSNFLSGEAAVEAFKVAQRTIAQKDQELKQLKEQIDKRTPELVKAQVQAELERLLKEAPAQVPSETEEEKALKADDPEAYRVLQLEKKIQQQDANMQNLQHVIDEIKQIDKARGITSEFKRVATDKKVPLNLVLAYGSLPQYANTPPEEVADIVIAELKEQGITLGEAKELAKTIPQVPANDVRPPVTGGAGAVSTDSISAEDIPELGSRGWKQFEKKLAQVALNRLRGGAG